MRPILHGDLSAAARVLFAAPPEGRAGLAAQLLTDAMTADHYARRTGRVHPRLGNGSLMGAARKHALAPEPSLDNLDYCRCLMQVLGAIVDRRNC